MQKKNMEDKMVDLSQEEMMNVSGGAVGKYDLLEKLIERVINIFTPDNSSRN